jgi:flagellar biosynthesis protein FlhG
MEPLGNVVGEPVTEALPAQMWAAGGGKGGVGKSLVTSMLAYSFARMGWRVVLVDGDLGGANLHTLLGIRVPKTTLEDFIARRIDSLEQALLPTPFEGVELLAGGSEVTALANPNYAQKSRLLRALNRLPADCILVDLGAGTSLNTLDFFLACPHKIVVVTPQPTAVENAYGFIKSALFRRVSRILPKEAEFTRLMVHPTDSDGRVGGRTIPDIVREVAEKAPEHSDALNAALRSFDVRLIVNMVKTPQEEQTGEVIRQVCDRYLSIDVRVAGRVPFDPTLERWAGKMDPQLFVRGPKDGAQRASDEIAYRLSPPVSRAA